MQWLSLQKKLHVWHLIIIGCRCCADPPTQQKLERESRERKRVPKTSCFRLGRSRWQQRKTKNGQVGFEFWGAIWCSAMAFCSMLCCGKVLDRCVARNFFVCAFQSVPLSLQIAFGSCFTVTGYLGRFDISRYFADFAPGSCEYCLI